jgi:hypothetical protein
MVPTCHEYASLLTQRPLLKLRLFQFFVSASCVLGIHGLVSGFEGLILKTCSKGIFEYIT